MAVPKSGDAAPKAFAGVFVILAACGGMWSMMQPLSQRMGVLEGREKESAADLQKHEEITGHSGLLELKSQSGEKFKEIETRIDAVRELYGEKHDDHGERLGKIEGRRWSEEDPAQNERLRALERHVWGGGE